MFPILLKIGPITIRTYGLLVAIGFFAALQYILIKAKTIGLHEDEILDIVLYTIVAGLIGGRLLYVMLNWSYYANNFLQIFQLWEGGLVFYGGFFLSIIVILAYAGYHKDFNLWGFSDIAAPAIAIGHFFGRLGCFFAGCCYGLPTDLPWACTFTNLNALAPLNIALHPTQVYEALGNLLIFLTLNWLLRFKHLSGQIFAVYLFLYGILRFHVEFLRGDDRGGFLFNLSPSQLISILMVLTGVYITVLRRKYGKNNI
ncbi:MAG: prolipoprotein diacylglyceryl transferase [Elusimicrobia bacterium]|nr:prolipoprotein diacylglyceryl transferase [Candidatus Liberimonas magnetica]